MILGFLVFLAFNLLGTVQIELGSFHKVVQFIRDILIYDLVWQ